jgi:hypothetical protein
MITTFAESFLWTIGTLTTSQNSFQKIPLNLIFERVAADDDSENLDLILHMYVCMYVCMYLDSQMSL